MQRNCLYLYVYSRFNCSNLESSIKLFPPTEQKCSVTMKMVMIASNRSWTLKKHRKIENKENNRQIYRLCKYFNIDVLKLILIVSVSYLELNIYRKYYLATLVLG